MQIALAAALISFVGTFALALLMLRWSPRIGLLDFPDARKPHTQVTPIGGLALLGGAALASLILLPLDVQHLGWIVGGLLMAALGLADDRFSLSASLKLAGQALVGLFAVLVFGFEIPAVEIFDLHIGLGLLAIPFAIFWIVGLTNAFNLIDGLDGLAVGAAAIAAGALLVINLFMGNELGLVLSAGLIGGAFGFILFNAHPARLFLGDGGSYFVGYAIAILSVVSFRSPTGSFNTVPLLVVFFVLLYPIADTLWAILRRMLAGRSIFSPDQQHLHHQVIKLNLGYGLSVFLLYLVFLLASLVALTIFLV